MVMHTACHGTAQEINMFLIIVYHYSALYIYKLEFAMRMPLMNREIYNIVVNIINIIIV